jgi:hypothetical protein
MPQSGAVHSIKSGADDRDDAAPNIGFAAKANAVRFHSRRQLLVNTAIAASRVAA